MTIRSYAGAKYKIEKAEDILWEALAFYDSRSSGAASTKHLRKVCEAVRLWRDAYDGTDQGHP